MNREFQEYYDRELALLYERTAAFGDTFPGISERLGGMEKSTMDPGLTAVLEGAAFMAARVQLKLNSEFSEFTSTLLEHLIPNYLAPTPSVMMVQATPNFADPDLVAGKNLPEGSYLDATYVERDRREACRFRLSAPLAMWPLHVAEADYFASAAPIQALGLDVSADTVAGLRLTLERRQTAPGVKAKKPAANPIYAVEIDELPVYLTGIHKDALDLYEQIFAAHVQITLRYLNDLGDPCFIRLDPRALEQIGFRDAERFFPEETRVFSGFAMLREYFMFPQKFLGFRLTGLRKLFANVTGDRVDILFEFPALKSRLAAAVAPDQFRINAAPAINLFEESISNIPVVPGQHEYLVAPNSGPMNREVHRILDVRASYTGQRDKVPVFPLYDLPVSGALPEEALYFTTRRERRRLTSEELRQRVTGRYRGTETFIAFTEKDSLDGADRVQRLQMRALCSNRAMTEHLPVGRGGADFAFRDAKTVPVSVIVPPTNPEESIATRDGRRAEARPSGETLWRLINLLSFNHLGLQTRADGDPTTALHEVLTLFADNDDSLSQKEIRGIKSITLGPCVCGVTGPDGFDVARGTEIRIRMDENALDKNGPMLLGAILERFFAEYTAINSFTRTVIETEQRGVIKTWPARSGTGPVL